MTENKTGDEILMHTLNQVRRAYAKGFLSSYIQGWNQSRIVLVNMYFTYTPEILRAVDNEVSYLIHRHNFPDYPYKPMRVLS